MNENSALQVFDFEDRQIRVAMKDGEPCLVAKDIVEGVGAVWKGDAGSIAFVPEEWKGVCSVQTPGGMQEMTVLTEQGVYFYLARSDKPAALPFQKKVAGEILPSIRRHGAYMVPEMLEKALTNPDLMIGILTKLKEEQEKRAKLEEHEKVLTAKIEEDHPKVLFADSVSASKTSILIGDLAKLIRQNGHEIGQRRMFQWLRDNGFLMKIGSSINMPTQRSMEMGLFEVLERTIDNPDGSVRITRTTKVTGRGQVYFVNRFVNPGLRVIEKTA
jgi:anti-repressor protein